MTLDCIRALARIPRTPDGPDWAKASPEDRAAAEQLFREDKQYLKHLARAEVSRHGGAVKHKDRDTEVYLDDPIKDDVYDSDDVTMHVEYGAWGADTGWGDVESMLPVWHHEAAVRFRPKKGVPWRGWLSRIIPDRVCNYLNSGSAAGMADHGDAPRYDPTFATIDLLGLTPLFEAANEEVRDRLTKLRWQKKHRDAAVLRGFWLSGKKQTKIAKEQGINKSAVSKIIGKFRKTIKHFNEALKVKKIVRRKRFSPEEETFLRTLCINYRGHPREIEPAYCITGQPLWVGQRLLVKAKVTDPELRPGASPRELLANVEQPAPRVYNKLHLCPESKASTEGLAEVIAEECASRDIEKCRLGDHTAH
jgi:DNA-directed RNA polymerase specialized sigma24 family protein